MGSPDQLLPLGQNVVSITAGGVARDKSSHSNCTWSRGSLFLGRSDPRGPGEDFPIFGELPSTSFLCDGRLPGYYADPEADCQMFHMCVDEEQLTPPLTDYPFLCPNGTLFSQQYFVCDW